MHIRFLSVPSAEGQERRLPLLSAVAVGEGDRIKVFGGIS